MVSITVEVCVDSVLSAQNFEPTYNSAVHGGANRLELCGDLTSGGGTTPSLGLLKRVRNAVGDTQIIVMIRPRTGDFLYSEEEFQVMLEDVEIFKKHQVSGFAAGFLTATGDVALSHTTRFAEAVSPFEFCFHRAFDMANDIQTAFATLSSISGVTRVLTSGHKPTAPEALIELEHLFKLKTNLSSHVAILPGSGINPRTAPDVLSLVPFGLDQIHMSGGQWLPGEMIFRREGMGMGDWRRFVCDESIIRIVRQAADRPGDRD